MSSFLRRAFINTSMTPVPSNWLIGEPNISTPALMMTIEMSVPKIPSRLIPAMSIMPADTRVDRVTTASNVALAPEAISESLCSFLPFALT